MDTHININSINIPALIYDRDNQEMICNENLNTLFYDEIPIEKIRLFLYDSLSNHQNTSTYYSIFNLEDKEYFLTFIKISDTPKYLITVDDSSTLHGAVRNMDIIRNMERDFDDILGAMHDDFVIIDKNGVIIKVLSNFEATYGISNEEVIGHTIYEMERRKIFNPSVAIRVFKSKEAETILQFTGANKYLMCTAIPIKDAENNIVKIISYTRDVTKYEALKDEYLKLEDTLKLYSAELEQLRQTRNVFPSVIGSSKTIKNITSIVNKISKFDANVLFTGDSGVGKTMFAKLMHSKSHRNTGPFLEINCGAIPDNLLESELFGYEKGAFTGASKEGKPGLIELANGGTLFLDEIGDLPLHMQVKLLKVIQDKKITKVGGSEEKMVDFRLIAATNKDIHDMVKNGTFREDLFYRLNVITIHIPSLRERKSDIFSLCMHFVEKFNKKYNLNRTLSNVVIDYLLEYTWPGNIRELENTIERLILTSDDYMITEDILPSKIKSHGMNASITTNKNLKEILEAVEKRVILEAYHKHKTSIGVAKELGISQPSASVKINKYTKENIQRNLDF